MGAGSSSKNFRSRAKSVASKATVLAPSLESDPRAAADHHDGLPDKRRLVVGRSKGGFSLHRCSSYQTAAGF
jgi:hypothetical protein